MSSLRRQLAAVYFSFDTRSLAAFRIALAVALFADLWSRYRVLDVFYTNDGILPNHTLLGSPPSRYMFSLFFSASHHAEALALMLVAALVFGALLVGLFTKLAQLLALIAVVSLNVRLAPLANAGDAVLSLLCIWSLFLPLGERFSVDAVRASLRRREQQSPRELNDRVPIRTPARRAYSLACSALLLQFVAIYLIATLPADAVHFALHQDRSVEWAGVWLREHATAGTLRALNSVAIACAALAAALILNPFGRRYTNLLALALLPGMHLVSGALIDLGVWSWAMIAFYPLLLEPTHWEWLLDKLARFHARRVVFVDEDCGFCMLCARLLARLDALERLEFASNADPPSGVSLEMANESITTLQIDSGRVRRGAAAFAEMFRSLPGGFALAPLLELPGLHGIAEWAYALVARNRLQISLWLGYAACGLPLTTAEAVAANTAAEPSQAAHWRARAGVIAREACVLLYLVAASSELANESGLLRHDRPRLLQALVEYPRAFQSWRVQVPPTDAMIEVDALTARGRHVDPFNELASRVPGPGYREIPEWLNQNRFFSRYSWFALQPSFAAYSGAFREWILRYPERTGRPEDRIVGFTVYKLRDHSPPLGATQPSNFERERLFEYHLPASRRSTD